MSKKLKHPPQLARRILNFLDHYENEFSIIGDCSEEFKEITLQKGRTWALLWLWGQVLCAVPANFKRVVVLGGAMLKNYIKIVLRNIKRQKVFSFINISGLAIGMACFILLLLFINSELSFDRYHTQKDRIFRICHEYIFSNMEGRGGSSNATSAEVLRSAYAEVIESARMGWVPVSSVKYKEREFSDTFRFADESVFKIFTWPLIKGDPDTALSAPYSIVITEESAHKYFKEEDPLGKILIFNESQAYTVTGVMQNIPRYSTMEFDGLCSFKTLYEQNPQSHILTDWISFNFETYILLREDVDYRVFESKIRNLLFTYAGEELKAKGAGQYLFLQPLRDIYLRSLNQDVSPITYVYIFTAIAIFILLIACANFMNLSTARAINRASEVGVRKVLGATRKKLIYQFLGESQLFSFLSISVALGLVFLVLPAVNDLVGRDLYQDILHIPWLIPGIIGLTLFVGLAAGTYPAFFLSRFQPAQVIKNRFKSLISTARLRRILVIMQFAISITLIIGTGLVMQQLDYLKHRDPGFNKDHVVVLPIGDDLVRKTLPVIKEKFKELYSVINTGAASSLPGWGSAINDKIPEGYTEENLQLMHEINMDEGFIPTLDIQIIAGRNFSPDFGTDPRGAVIVNETAVRKFGWDNPLGKTIKTYNHNDPDIRWDEKKVIGVIKDYHIRGVMQTIEPAFIANVVNHPYSYGQLHALAVRIKPESILTTLEKLEDIWKGIFPQKPFDFYFLDESFNQQFAVMERSRNNFSYFTFLAIFIACLGLLGMAMYTAEKRTKEIGIRKILGSSALQIVILLSKELLLLIITANIIAYPIAYYFTSQWLQDFPYRIKINIYTFILSTLLALVISMATIAFQSLKAALANPVDSLRYE